MERYHPVINLIYFGLVIGCSMVFLHPVCLFVSIVCAAGYTVTLFGFKKALKGFGVVIILMLLTALINPAFSHQGVTELMELPGGNMLTLESMLFGVAAAFMLGSTLLWFRAVSEILTSDKIVYQFGRAFPILGLLLSMILGFIPKVRKKYFEIAMCRAKELNTGNRFYRFKYKLSCYISNISVLITWILEDSIEMGRSMKGRGYGIYGRTRYTIYRFTKRDALMLLFILVTGIYVIAGAINGAVSWYYYPVTGGAGGGAYSISVYAVYAMLCFCPVFETIGAAVSQEMNGKRIRI